MCIDSERSSFWVGVYRRMDRYKLQILTAVRAVLLPAINDLNLVKKRIVVIFFEFAKMTVYLKKKKRKKKHKIM